MIATRVMKSEVLAALKVALKVADRKSTMPILNKFKVSASEGFLRVTSTDLDVTVDAVVPCTGSDLAECLVDARRFVQAVNECAVRRRGRNSPDKEIVISKDRDSLMVAGEASFTLAAESADDFPHTLYKGTFDCLAQYDGPAFLSGLSYVAKAVCQDETRFHLNGVYFAENGDLVATDGHRLHKQSGFPVLKSGSILPSTGVKVLLATLKAFAPDLVTSCFAAKVARFTSATPNGGYLQVTMKPIDTRYPPYEAVIPRRVTEGVTLNREATLAISKTALKLCAETRGMVVATCQAETVMSVKCDEGEVKQTLAGALKGGCDSLAWGINPRYLAETLECLSGTDVSLMSGGELDPILIEEGNRTSVIMPMRI